jgi:glucosamine-6-phosphate deaminase
MRLLIEETAAGVAAWAARHIASRINAHRGPRPFVLGLPTGSTPLATYAERV